MKMQNNYITDTEQLLRRIEYLEGNRRYVHNALESVFSLGDFQESVYSIRNPNNILQEAASRIGRLISFETRAMYIVNQDTSDFTLSAFDPDTAGEMIEKEVLFMIDKGFFAWALREKRGVTIASMNGLRQFVLHVIANYSRIRGMFIGLLPERKYSIPDTSMILLSIILLNTANALESFEFYDLMNNQKHILEQKVKARTRELIRSERRLQQLEKMEALGTMAGGVAHDLNNVLSGIVSYPELMLLDLPEDSPLRKPIMTIKESGEKAASIVQDGGTIVIVTENRYIDCLINGYDKVEEGDYVILTVSDIGSGISAKDLKSIFEPFYTKKKKGVQRNRTGHDCGLGGGQRS